MEYSTGKCTSVLCHHQQSQQRFELRTGGVCLSESLFQPITVRFLLSHWISIFVAPRWQQTLQKHTHTQFTIRPRPPCSSKPVAVSTSLLLWEKVGEFPSLPLCCRPRG